jgi:hypothetical protein
MFVVFLFLLSFLFGRVGPIGILRFIGTIGIFHSLREEEEFLNSLFHFPAFSLPLMLFSLLPFSLLSILWCSSFSFTLSLSLSLVFYGASALTL